MDINGLTNIPMFFVSPVADSSLAYSNIMAEWLSTSKQNRVYIPEEPFPHGHLSRTGRLKSFRSLHDENFSNEYRQVRTRKHADWTIQYSAGSRINYSCP